MATVHTPLQLAHGSRLACADEHTTFTFDAVYGAYAPFVWRSVCRLGVPLASAEDVVQEIFLVVHRRLPEFEERTSISAWLFAIVIRVVRGHRRTQKRKSPGDLAGASSIDPDSLTDTRQPSPLDAAQRGEALRTLYALLDQLGDERREVFVLAELEQLTAPEIAHALGVNLNTVYWRLRTARRDFEKCILRKRAADERNRP